MEKLNGLSFTDSSATLNCNSKTGNKVSIALGLGKFEPTKHKLYFSDTVWKFIHNEKRIDHLIAKNLIDDKLAYGVDGDFPKTEIKYIKIKFNGNWLTIPKSSFANFYEVHTETIEAYLSKDKKFIFLYISASDGIGSYAIKFVFDKTKFVTRLISTNECTDGFDFLDALPQDCQ
ncbi:MAG: hypothetical protein IPJ60_12715 [Sphingobacteriaceae bacterium]|nr:hypothetical protein [Sphingobacteriaceae bacterium]